MPQQEYDTCTGCGRMFHMKTEWLVYLGHTCKKDTPELEPTYEY